MKKIPERGKKKRREKEKGKEDEKVRKIEETVQDKEVGGEMIEKNRKEEFTN